jgi:hypothetical protein
MEEVVTKGKGENELGINSRLVEDYVIINDEHRIREAGRIWPGLNEMPSTLKWARKESRNGRKRWNLLS